MRQRISAQVDYNILADIALGLPAKDLAIKYGVSVSYISKIKTGRKKIDVYIPEQAIMANRLAFYESDIDKLSQFLKTEPLSLKDGKHDSLDGLIIQKIAELKTLLATRSLLKGETK